MNIGNTTKLCTAITIQLKRDRVNNIAENEFDYWVHNMSPFKLRAKISKSHKVGKKITEMIENNTFYNDIYNYVGDVLLKKLTAKDLKIEIINIQNEFYDKGCESKIKEFKKVLNL